MHQPPVASLREQILWLAGKLREVPGQDNRSIAKVEFSNNLKDQANRSTVKVGASGSSDLAKSESEPARPPTDFENPKCDRACADGNEDERVTCNFECARMQKQMCGHDFNCHKACGNHLGKLFPKDPECELLCDTVHGAVCAPFDYEGRNGLVSPHHDDQVPPSVEATPPPSIVEGQTIFCNLYPADYDFEVLELPTFEAKTGPVVTKLAYKQCNKIHVKSFEAFGIRSRGQMAGISRQINKVPSVMVFGQWAFGNHQVDFNRYYAKGNGAMVCNGFPIWEPNDRNKGLPVALLRGGYSGKEIAKLRYKECVPTGLGDGDVLAAVIEGNQAGTYIVVGRPSAIVIGKAGESTAISFEAWTDDKA